jgi:hypothetical protein
MLKKLSWIVKEVDNRWNWLWFMPSGGFGISRVEHLSSAVTDRLSSLPGLACLTVSELFKDK